MNRAIETGWYALSLVLVPVFVSTFPVWLWLGDLLPSPIPAALPVVLTLAFVPWAVIAWRRAQSGEAQPALGPLIAALALAAAALLIADPRFPAKRVHVPEYVLLALVVRRALAFRLAGGALAAWTAVVTAVLGVHDELLQGLHPVRSFGGPDIIVNALAGIAGALMGHGLALFGASSREPPRESREAVSRAAISAAVAVLGLALLVTALLQLAGQAIPAWCFLPLVAAGLYWALAPGSGDRAPGADRAAAVVVCLCMLAVVEPGLANVTSLDFR